MEDILVPIALFGSIPLTVWIVSRGRVRAHEASAKVMKSMIEKGEPLTPEIIKTLGTRQVKPHGDLRLGIILVALAIATALFGGFIPDDEAGPVLAGLAMFPGLVGLAYIGFWLAVGRKAERTPF